MSRRNIVQIRLSDPEREHAAGEARRAGQRLAEWGRAAVKAILFQRVVRQLEQVRDRLSLKEPRAFVALTREGVVLWGVRDEKEFKRQARSALGSDYDSTRPLAHVGMRDKRELLEATAEWLIGEAGK